MNEKGFDAKLAEIDEQIARAKERRRALVQRNAKEERRARNHALIVAGGLLMRCFDGGWQSVDWPGLKSLIENNRELFAAKTAEALPTPEASRRLRAWERSSGSEVADVGEA